MTGPRQRYAGFDGSGPDHLPEQPPPSPDPVRKLEREVEQLRAENKALRSVVATSVRVLQPYANSVKREDRRR
jgi:hypothetical protein